MLVKSSFHNGALRVVTMWGVWIRIIIMARKCFRSEKFPRKTFYFIGFRLHWHELNLISYQVIRIPTDGRVEKSRTWFSCEIRFRSSSRTSIQIGQKMNYFDSTQIFPCDIVRIVSWKLYAATSAKSWCQVEMFVAHQIFSEKQNLISQLKANKLKHIPVVV